MQMKKLIMKKKTKKKMNIRHKERKKKINE